jgi:DNA-binding NarL/FixJ family response regulator
MTKRIRVLVIADHRAVGEGLVSHLEAKPEIDVVGHVGGPAARLVG